MINETQWFTTCSLTGAVKNGKEYYLSPTSVSLLINAVQDFRQIPNFVNDLVIRGYQLEIIKTLFEDGGYFHKKLSTRTNKAGIPYLQLLAEHCHCTSDGTRHMNHILDHIPNRVKDLGYSPDDIDNLKIIYTLVRSITALEGKMSPIHDRLNGEVDGIESDDVVNYIIMNDHRELIPGNIPDKLRVLVDETVQTDQLIADLMIVYIVNILKTLDSLKTLSYDSMSELLRLITYLEGLDTEFKTLLSTHEAKRYFNSYPFVNMLLKEHERSSSDTGTKLNLSSLSEETTITIAFGEGVLDVQISTTNYNT